MIIIRKQNFESELCSYCEGLKRNVNDPKYSEECVLYHSLPESKQYLKIKVQIPRCKRCAEKMKPVLPISIAIAAILGVTMFLTNTIFVAILSTIVTTIILIPALIFAFKIVYGQNVSSNDIVSVLMQNYDWKQTEPGAYDKDEFFTESELLAMLDDLTQNYGCEIIESNR